MSKTTYTLTQEDLGVLIAKHAHEFFPELAGKMAEIIYRIEGNNISVELEPES